MPNYFVTWEIDIDGAVNPWEAAKIARSLQHKGTSALVFKVMDNKGKETVVDLEESDVVREMIRVDKSRPKGLPLLVGALKTKEAQARLEERLKEL